MDLWSPPGTLRQHLCLCIVSRWNTLPYILSVLPNQPTRNDGDLYWARNLAVTGVLVATLTKYSKCTPGLWKCWSLCPSIRPSICPGCSSSRQPHDSLCHCSQPPHSASEGVLEVTSLKTVPQLLSTSFIASLLCRFYRNLIPYMFTSGLPVFPLAHEGKDSAGSQPNT